MSRLITFALTLFLAMIAVPAAAQTLSFSPTRLGNITQTHTTVGTTTADAIASASVLPALQAWAICNDAVNASTYLIVGEAADAATDGRTLLPGACYECPNCTPATLKAMKVKGQAAANGYSVIQYKQ